LQLGSLLKSFSISRENESTKGRLGDIRGHPNQQDLKDYTNTGSEKLLEYSRVGWRKKEVEVLPV
jgi:hypothetical protein